MSSEGKLDLIMARNSAGELCVWACRGAGKGCARNEHRRTKKPCADCIGPLPDDMTVGEVQDRLRRGDA